MILEYDIDGHLSLNILIAIFVVIITGVLSYFIFRSIKKERKKFREEAINYIDGLIQRNELIADVTTYISRSAAAEFSLIYIDIDKFSNIIDAFGKDEANNILSKIAYTLVDNLPPRVEITRLQDDKFVAFARGEYRQNEVEEIAIKLLDAVSRPIKFFGDNEITVTASIGIALYPSHGLTYKDLINDAEIAVYLCKREGGNNFKFYSLENMNESANLAYYQQIKKGIKNKEFCLYYQPIIDTKNNTVYSVEGLLRWNHPEYGILSPFKFINIMEQTGDINWVGQWGLETLAKEQVYLSKKYPDYNILLSMNLSPKQLVSPTIVENFSLIMKKQKASTKNIILEIEEFTLFEKHPVIKQNIANLSKMGFKIAVDGFGLDYSTLAKLEAMPIDIVKVDNDFLENENENFLKEKFVHILVDYTEKEEKNIVVEGIENKEMYDRAKDMKLDIMQGYLFAKPMDPEALDEYFSNQEWNKVLNPTKDVVEGSNFIDNPEYQNKEENENNPSLEETNNDEVRKEKPKKKASSKKKNAEAKEEIVEDINAESFESTEAISQEESLESEVSQEEVVENETPQEEVVEEKQENVDEKE